MKSAAVSDPGDGVRVEHQQILHDPGVGCHAPGVQTRPDAPRRLGVEPVQIEPADLLEEFYRPGIGERLGHLVALVLVLPLQGPESWRARKRRRRSAG